MAPDNLEQLLETYENILSQRGLDDELYKWRAVKHFQDNYNPAAENFGEMFLNSIARQNNLIDRWQKPFIEELAQLNSEGMRSLIERLYDESIDIEERVATFRERAEALAQELEDHPEHDSRKKLKQDERTMSVYLGLRYPERYPFYKHSYYKKTCNLLRQPTEKVWKRFLHFRAVASEVRDLLRREHPSIVATVHSLRTEDCYQGDDTWLIAQNSLYDTLDRFYDNTASSTALRSAATKYWLVSPGERSALWRNAIEDGVIRIGWDVLGDLSEYESQEAIRDTLIESDGRGGSRKNDSLACWQFCNEMKVGDILIAKQGRSTLLGWGEVVGDYEYREAYDSFNNTRRVNWRKTGEWPAESITLHSKTLTDFTPYTDDVEKIRRVIWEEPAEKRSAKLDLPLNLILYGPPGTGKTYRLQTDLFPYFTDSQAAQSQHEFTSDLVANMSWWEVVSAVMVDLKKARVGEIFAHPLTKSKVELSSNNSPRAAIWAQLQSHTKPDCPNVNYTKRIEPLLFWKDDQSSWTIDADLARETTPQVIELVEKWKRGPTSDAETQRYVFTTFHQSYSYEDFVEGIRPVLEDGAEGLEAGIKYEIRPGVFKEIAKRAALNPGKPHAIFIDEINRGNIAGIFGELITLIEDDKRAGEDSEISVTLPYSREKFSVPNNLHIIGTMNTADRSVQALDTALRRRFSFQEMLPQPEVIPNKIVDGVDLPLMLATINERLEAILDKDHTVGHAFFMTCQSLRDLRSVFQKKVMPLLEEFFYNDSGKIGMVLGPGFVRSKQTVAKFAPGDWGPDDFDREYSFELADIASLPAQSFISIYSDEA